MDADGWQSSAFLLSYIHKRKKPLYEPLLVHRNNFVLHLSIYFILWRHPYIHPTKTCWWSAGWLTVYIWVFVRSFPSLQVHWGHDIPAVLLTMFKSNILGSRDSFELHPILNEVKWRNKGNPNIPTSRKIQQQKGRIIASATLWGVMNSTLNITPQFLTVG